jgi:hypothetical protein
MVPNGETFTLTPEPWRDSDSLPAHCRDSEESWLTIIAAGKLDRLKGIRINAVYRSAPIDVSAGLQLYALYPR